MSKILTLEQIAELRIDDDGEYCGYYEISCEEAYPIFTTLDAYRAVLEQVAVWENATEQAIPYTYPRMELQRLGRWARNVLNGQPRDS